MSIEVPIRPLFGQVDPHSQMIPTEVNVEGFHQSTHHVNDVHQSSDAFDVNVAEVIVGQRNRRQVGRTSTSSTCSGVI